MERKINKFFIPFVSFLAFSLTSCGPSAPKDIKVTEFSFSLSSSEIKKGSTCVIQNVQVLPENATNKNIMFWSEDSAIASVYEGTVTGLYSGATKVCGKTTDGSNITFKVDITVIENLVNEIQLSTELTTFTLDDVFTPTVNVLPSTAENKEYDIVANNQNVTIDNVNKKITCVKAGKTIIKAVAKDASKTVSNKVEITIKNPVTTAISLSADKTVIEKNATSQINITYTPLNAVDKTVRYSTASGTSSILSVSNTGLVTGKGIGTETVKVYLVSNPNVKDEIEFTITDIEPTSVSINLPNTVYKGDVYHAKATVLPADAFQTTPQFSIVSGSANITEDGTLVPLGTGTIKVKVALKERPNINSTISINCLEGPDPDDPYVPDDF